MASHRKSAGKRTSEFGFYAERARHGVSRNALTKAVGREAKTGEFLFNDTIKPKSVGFGRVFDSSKHQPENVYALRLKNEREARVLYYYELAGKALGDQKLAQKFMTKKHPKLGVAPIEKLDTEWGGREVEQVLNAIIYGLPA